MNEKSLRLVVSWLCIWLWRILWDMFLSLLSHPHDKNSLSIYINRDPRQTSIGPPCAKVPFCYALFRHGCCPIRNINLFLNEFFHVDVVPHYRGSTSGGPRLENLPEQQQKRTTSTIAAMSITTAISNTNINTTGLLLRTCSCFNCTIRKLYLYMKEEVNKKRIYTEFGKSRFFAQARLICRPKSSTLGRV
jgi:hypothetical protein